MSKLVGILNITPDSFSDGGIFFSPEKAIAAAQEMIADGASIIDIGAESTRPGAIPITQNEEWSRLSPVIKQLQNIPFSVDTRHTQTAKFSLECGAAWINDVSGFLNPEMISAVKNSNCKLVFMHSLSVPASKDIVLPADINVVDFLIEWAREKIVALEKSGIARERLIFDPGLGFGKTAAQSRTIINNIEQFKSLVVPLLIGHSRKSFLGDTDRDAATLALSKTLAAQGVDYLRVHDVRAHKGMM